MSESIINGVQLPEQNDKEKNKINEIKVLTYDSILEYIKLCDKENTNCSCEYIKGIMLGSYLSTLKLL